jgi:hypothetical protein
VGPLHVEDELELVQRDLGVQAGGGKGKEKEAGME